MIVYMHSISAMYDMNIDHVYIYVYIYMYMYMYMLNFIPFTIPVDGPLKTGI